MDFIIIAVLGLLGVLAVRSIIKNRKSGGCGCGCESCGTHCHDIKK